MWLAMVGRERIEEIIDPELTIERALDTYARKGYSPEWINQQLQTIRARKERQRKAFGAIGAALAAPATERVNIHRYSSAAFPAASRRMRSSLAPNSAGTEPGSS